MSAAIPLLKTFLDNALCEPQLFGLHFAELYYKLSVTVVKGFGFMAGAGTRW